MVVCFFFLCGYGDHRDQHVRTHLVPTRRSSEWALVHWLGRVVRWGRLAIIDPGGRTHTLGDGTPPHVRLRIVDPAAPRRLVLNPPLAFGEAYMDEIGRAHVNSSH